MTDDDAQKSLDGHPVTAEVAAYVDRILSRDPVLAGYTAIEHVRESGDLVAAYAATGMRDFLVGLAALGIVALEAHDRGLQS